MDIVPIWRSIIKNMAFCWSDRWSNAWKTNGLRAQSLPGHIGFCIDWTHEGMASYHAVLTVITVTFF